MEGLKKSGIAKIRRFTCEFHFGYTLPQLVFGILKIG